MLTAALAPALAFATVLAACFALLVLYCAARGIVHAYTWYAPPRRRRASRARRAVRRCR
jgi:hypothetical protein